MACSFQLVMGRPGQLPITVILAITDLQRGADVRMMWMTRVVSSLECPFGIAPIGSFKRLDLRQAREGRVNAATPGD